MLRLLDVNFNGLYCVLWGWCILVFLDVFIVTFFFLYIFDVFYKELVIG